MTDKSKFSIGKTHKPKRPVASKDEIIGNYWRAWFDGKNYYFEFDEGHFASKFKVVEISREEFLEIKSGKITEKDLTAKYSI